MKGFPDALEDWTPDDRAALVMEILAGRISADVAAHVLDVSTSVIDEWRSAFIEGGRQAMGAGAAAPRWSPRGDKGVRNADIAAQIASDLAAARGAEMDTAIQRALTTLGAFCEVDNAYLMEVDMVRGVFSLGALWRPPDLAPLETLISNQPIDGIRFWLDRLARGVPIQVEAAERLGPEVEDVRRWMQAYGIRSVLDAPMIEAGQLVGFVGMTCERQARQWSAETVSLVRSVAGVMVSARSRARREMELARTVARFSSFVEYVDEGMVCVDFNTPLPVTAEPRELAQMIWSSPISVANEAARDYLGLEDTEPLLGQTLDTVYARRLATPLKEARRRLIALAQGADPGQSFEMTDHFSDGRVRIVMRRSRLVREGDCHVRFWMGQRDITERRAEEAERIAMAERLQIRERLESVGLLAGGVAHDFNNLLVAILGYTEMALEEPGLPESVVECLEEIRGGGARAARLVNQLLAFSRRQALERAACDLNGLVGELIAMLRRLMPESHSLVFLPGGAGSVVWVDASQIEQVVINLVVNARDAMPGGGTITLTTRVEPSEAGEEEVSLVVSDTGEGISPEHMPRLFEPFFTTKAVGHGTGLGLATVYGVVQQHGGQVQVDSTLGEGTTFTIRLPVATGSQVAHTREQTPPPSGGDERLLVVEDDLHVARVVDRVLTRAGYQVELAADGATALRRVEDAPDAYDLAIVDVIMPGMNGAEVLKALKAIRGDLPVLLSSGYTANILEDVLGAGFPDADILPKPFTPDALLSRVRLALDRPVEP